MSKFKYHILIASFLLSAVLWLSLNLNQVYEIERSIPVKININKPYAVTGNIPLNLEVKFKGVGWNLIRLFTSLNLEFNYDVNTRGNEKFIILTKSYLENSLGSSQNVTIDGVYPETLFVNIESYEEKYVKLIPAINVECREGYQIVGKPIIEPDSIKIGGGINMLRNINFLYTQREDFNSVNAGIIKNIGVSDSLSNIIWRSQNEVKLTVNVELTAEKELSNVEVKVSNIPTDREVLLIPQMVTIQLKGGVNQLSAVDVSRINSFINFNNILSDTTGALSPVFEVPEGCVVTAVRPDKIQYVIKKK